MNTHDILQLLRQGFQVSIGAATSLIEVLQNLQKSSDRFSELQIQLTQKVQELAQKGEVTEQEVCRLMNEWLNQQQEERSSTFTNENSDGKLTFSSNGNKNAPETIKKLTEQVIALRIELENLRQSD
ncbi:hypothetical protein [Cyanobacterium sp. uoEpiScrs1]|uniref:hypothetical protein n=1 Tax=Cyanobacterium sp. uoEpiScrs1 TaxID=2976343 RepID=UPI00226AD276|nr:hypothetical protein [Cyanobacterium sp. uoEpiScrs1]